MDFKYNLAMDEAVVRSIEEVSLHEEATGVLGLRNSSRIKGSLVLTNKRLLFCWESGMLFSKQETIEVPLAQVKVFDGSLQLKVDYPRKVGGPLSLTVFTLDNQFVFEIPVLKKLKLDALIADANKIVLGEDAGKSSKEKAKPKTLDVGKTVSHAVNAAKPVAQDAADVLKPFVPVAAAVVSTAFPAAGAVSDALGKALSNRGASTDRGGASSVESLPSSSGAESKDALNDQVEALTKLKSLLDEGILTQEEFDVKKRQILGL